MLLRPNAKAAAVLIGAALCVYWPLFIGQSYALRDFIMWAIGSRAVYREALLGGELALWNPYVGIGMPHVADPQNGVFYPLQLLLGLLPPVSGLNLFYLLHILIAGAGGYAFGRALGACRAGALATGLTTMLCGVTTGGWGAGIGALSAAWLPWAAVAAVRLGRLADRRLTSLVLLAVPFALMLLVGEPFHAARAGLLLFPLVVGASAREGRSMGRNLATQAALWTGALLLGAFIAAPGWLPGADMVQDSDRAGGFALEIAERWSLHPLRLVEMVTPGLFGNATDPSTMVWTAEPELGPISFHFSVYMGVSLLVFAPLLAIRGTRPADLRIRRIVVALVVAFGLALVLALGRYTPIHRLARLLVPPLAYVRFPEKYMDVASLLAAGLIGLGVTRALVAAAVARLWALGGAVVAGAVAGLGALLGAPPTASGACLHVSLVAIAAFLGLEMRRRNRRVGTGIVICVIALDLIISALPLLRWVPGAEIAEAKVSVAPGKTNQPPVRVHRNLVGYDWSRIAYEDRAVVGARTFVGNIGAFFRVGSVPGYEAALPATYRQLWSDLSARPSDALRLMSVGYAILPEGVYGKLEAVGTSEPAVVYKVRDVLPRAYLAGRASYVESSSLAQAVVSSRVLGGEEALVTDPGDVLEGSPGRAGDCRFSSYNPAEVVLSCDVSRPAMLVLVEAFAPGWQATVDGADAPVLRVQGVMRGLRLEPGQRQIAFHYRPWTVPVAGVLSLLGICLAFAGWGLGRRAQKPSREPVVS